MAQDWLLSTPSQAQEEACLGQFCFLAALEMGSSWVQLEGWPSWCY